MAQIIQTPDGTAEFPDGMASGDIEKVLAAHYAPPAPPASTDAGAIKAQYAQGSITQPQASAALQKLQQPDAPSYDPVINAVTSLRDTDVEPEPTLVKNTPQGSMGDEAVKLLSQSTLPVDFPKFDVNSGDSYSGAGMKELWNTVAGFGDFSLSPMAGALALTGGMAGEAGLAGTAGKALSTAAAVKFTKDFVVNSQQSLKTAYDFTKTDAERGAAGVDAFANIMLAAATAGHTLGLKPAEIKDSTPLTAEAVKAMGVTSTSGDVRAHELIPESNFAPKPETPAPKGSFAQFAAGEKASLTPATDAAVAQTSVGPATAVADLPLAKTDVGPLFRGWGLQHDGTTPGMDENGKEGDYHQVTDSQAVDKDGNHAIYSIPADASVEEAAKIVADKRQQFSADTETASAPATRADESGVVSPGSSVTDEPVKNPADNIADRDPFTPYQKGEKWHVPFLDKGDMENGYVSIHDTPEDAQKQADWNRAKGLSDTLRAQEAERVQAEAARAKAEKENLDGFGEDLSARDRGGIVAQLSREFNWRGKPTTRRDIIRQMVGEGRTVETEDGARILSNEQGEFLGEKVLTKAGMDYAQHLIDLRNAPSKLAGYAGAGELGSVSGEAGSGGSSVPAPEEPPKVGNQSAIPTPEEESRWNALSAYQKPIVDAMEGDTLDKLAAEAGVKRGGVGDAALREKILNNTHPDDLSDALKAVRGEEPTPSTEPPAQTEPAPEQPGSAQSEPAEVKNPSAETTPATEEKQPDGGIVALQRAFTDAQREKMGLPKWVDPAELTNKEAWDKGQAVLAENPDRGKQLVEEMKSKPRALEPYEKAILLNEEGLRDTAYHAAIDAVNKAKNEGERLSAQTTLAATRAANGDIYDATRASGRASGQSLQAHKLALDSETWTLARMEWAIKAMKPFGKELSGREQTDIAELHAKFAEQRKVDADAHTEEKNAIVSKLMDRVLADIKSAKTNKAAGKSLLATLKEGADASRLELRKKLGQANSGIDPSILLHVAKIGAYHIANGAAELVKWTAKLKDDLGERIFGKIEPHLAEIRSASEKQAEIVKLAHEGTSKGPKTSADILKGASPGGEIDPKMVFDLVQSEVAKDPGVKLDKGKVSEIMQTVQKTLDPIHPGITEDQVRDAFSGHGKVKFPNPEEIASKTRELKRASDIISKLKEAEAKEPVKKTGSQQDKPSPFVRELTKELIRTMRENGVDSKGLDDRLKTAHDTRVTRLTNAIEDTQRQLEAGKRTPKTPGTEWTPDELKLKDQLGAIKGKLDALLNEPDSDEVHAILDRIEKVTDKLASGNIDPKAKSQNVPTRVLSEARDKLAELNKELADRRKAKAAAENPPKTEDEKKLASLEKQERDLTDSIQTGKIDPKTGKATVDVKEVAEARIRVAALRDQIAEARKAKRLADNPPPTPDEKKLADLTAHRDQLAKDIAAGKIDVKTGKPTVATQAQAAVKAEIDALNKQKVEMRKAANPALPEHIQEWHKLQDRLDDAKDRLARMDLANPKAVKATVKTQEIAESKKELKAVNATIADLRKKTVEGVARDLNSYKGMIDQKSQELQAKIDRSKNGVSPEDLQRTPRQISDAKTKAALPLKLLQEKWEAMKRNQELKNQNVFQKTLRWTTYLGHEMLLLGSHVGQKLATAAATTSAIVSPAEEVAGYVLGKTLPFMAEKGDVEIAPSASSLVRHEATAAADAFLRVIDDIGSTLKNGKADFELEFGKHYDTEMVSYVGRVHGCLKTVPARQAFRRTFERLSEKYAERGLSVADPDVRLDIGTKALVKALESKFQDPNLAVKMFKAGLRTAEQAGPSVGAVTKAIARTEMPVMTVASNITWRVFEGVYGLPVAGARIGAQALSNLMHNTFGRQGGSFVEHTMRDMTTEQVESIAKQFKRGTVGLAAFAIGAYAYKNYGGFYQQGQKKEKGDVPQESVRPPKWTGIPDIPKEFIHHPLFTDMQAGAATMQVAASRLHRNDAEKQGLGQGAMSAAASVAGESPLGNAARSVSNLFNPYTRQDAVGAFARTMLGISGPVTWLAKKTDEGKNGEPIQRSPRNFKEQLEIGIPGLRKNVPVKRTR